MVRELPRLATTSAIVPEKVLLTLPLRVRLMLTGAEELPNTTLPPPESPPTTGDPVVKFTVPAGPTVSSAVPRALLLPAVNTPALTVVPPL